jgi:hypothetical protein
MAEKGNWDNQIDGIKVTKEDLKNFFLAYPLEIVEFLTKAQEEARSYDKMTNKIIYTG